jgi:hypothetical protein
VLFLLAFTLLTPMLYAQSPQDVTTWHNDNNRTGWQSHETILSADPNSAGYIGNSKFGLLTRWSVTGAVFAQPLAVANVTTNTSTCHPCDLVFVATEKDMLYAFNASTNSSTAVWSLNLASSMGGSPVDCNALPFGFDYDPCPQQLLSDHVGVTGTPVIDMVDNRYTLYVVAAVQFSPNTNNCQNQDPFCFYLFAVDIRTGIVIASQLISGIVNGFSPDPGGYPAGDCTSTFPHTGQVTFEYHHIQRSALLLLPNGTVYVAFSAGGGAGDPHGEITNGWMFAYTLNNGTGLGQAPAIFNSTPYGTGGGIWQAGGGPAYDGTHIYANTANGTLFDPVLQTIPFDIGDSLLQIDPSSLVVTDFYTPKNVLSYPGNGSQGTGLCKYDEDFGSGGVLVPTDFTYTGGSGGCSTSNPCSIVITADKQSKLYVVNRSDLGKFNSNGGNNIQTVVTPPIPTKDLKQGYWASPAFWKTVSGSTTNYMLYYSATMRSNDAMVPPHAINAYQLAPTGTNGPIPSTYASTTTLFCDYSPTPSVSSNGTDPTSGIVWAIEHQNQDNPSNNDCAGSSIPHVALHAFNATTMAEIYDSRNVVTTTGPYTSFATPTIFKGQVYVGTQGEVDVFGLLH